MYCIKMLGKAYLSFPGSKTKGTKWKNNSLIIFSEDKNLDCQCFSLPRRNIIVVTHSIKSLMVFILLLLWHISSSVLFPLWTSGIHLLYLQIIVVVWTNCQAFSKLLTFITGSGKRTFVDHDSSDITKAIIFSIMVVLW